MKNKLIILLVVSIVTTNIMAQPMCTVGVITAPAKNCGNEKSTIQLTAPAGGGGTTYLWSGPNIKSGGATAVVTVGGAGTWTCTINDPTKVPVVCKLDVIVASETFFPQALFQNMEGFNGDSLRICRGDNIKLKNMSLPKLLAPANVAPFWTAFAWDINNDGTTEAITQDYIGPVLDPENPPLPSGETPPRKKNVTVIPVKLSVSNGTSCKTDTVINIKIVPKPTAKAGNDHLACFGATEFIDPIIDNQSIDSSFRWDVQNVTNPPSPFVFNKESAYDIAVPDPATVGTSVIVNNPMILQLTVTNTFGCKDTDLVNVAVNASCCVLCETNPGFELGTANWAPTSNEGINIPQDAPNNVGSHSIVTTGNDEFGGYPRVCPLIPDNGSSFRIGNRNTGSGNQGAQYSFTVSVNKPYFTYYYALTLQDAGGGHGPACQPNFIVSMFDGLNNRINCADYSVNGGNAAAIGGFNVAGDILTTQAWRAVTVPLTPYIGQCVNINFSMLDCCAGGHFGYAYIDAACVTPDIVSPEKICDNGKSNITLRAPAGAATYAWVGTTIAPGAATNTDTLGVNNSGTYTCNMTTPSVGGGQSCPYSATRNIFAAPIPVVKFKSDTVCAKQKTVITNLSTPDGIWTSYEWDYNNDATIDGLTLNTESYFNNPSNTDTIHIPIKLTISNEYCKGDTVLDIVIKPNPIADAGLDKIICYGDLVALKSTVNNHYQWYKDLNNYSTIIDTNMVYSTIPANTSDYSLIVTNNFGCKDTDDVKVTVNRVPTANFLVNDVCFPDSLRFISTTGNAKPGDIYTWLFEPNKSASGPANNVVYKYDVCNTKTITLVVTTPDNCVSTITKNAEVFCKPDASFNVTNVCVYDSLVLNNTSVGNNTITNNQWDFDYGSIDLNIPTYIATNSAVKNSKHKYAVDGNKNIVLVVTNNFGCKDSAIKTVTIYPKPRALYTVDNSCLKVKSVFVSNSIINAPDNISQYEWDYNNDGNYADDISFANIQNHVYPNLYKGNTNLIVTSNNGCKDTATVPIEIYPLPTAAFYAKNVCADSTVTFINKSTVGYGTIKSSVWNYTTIDGAVTNGIDTTIFVYNAPNYYPVLLTAVTNFGCIDTQKQVTVIYPNPIPNFTSNNKGCAPYYVTEINTSTISTMPVPSIIVKNNWSFGTGDTSDDLAPEYWYKNDTNYEAKKYTVSLKTESNYGCINSITKVNYVEVYPKPKANFYVTPKVFEQNKDVVQLFDSSIIATIINWDYDVTYNPTTTNDLKYKVLNYRDSGKYTITQYVESKYGCKDTAYQTIVVKPSYNLFVPNAFTPNDDGTNDYFNPKYFGMTKVDLMIFNRWGDLIARVDETNKNGWNGTDYRTQEKCKTDVYVWKIKYTTVQGNSEEADGKVSLLR